MKTSNLTQHIKNHHPEIKLEEAKSNNNTDTKDVEMPFDMEVSETIARLGLPLNIVENKLFKRILKQDCPGRKAVNNNILKLKSELFSYIHFFTSTNSKFPKERGWNLPFSCMCIP